MLTHIDLIEKVYRLAFTFFSFSFRFTIFRQKNQLTKFYRFSLKAK